MFEGGPKNSKKEEIDPSRRKFLKQAGAAGAAGLAGGLAAPSVKKILNPEPLKESDFDRLADDWVDAVERGDKEAMELGSYVIENYNLELATLISLYNSLNKSLSGKSWSQGSRALLEMNLRMVENRIKLIQDEIKFISETVRSKLSEPEGTKRKDSNTSSRDVLKRTM